VLDLSYNQMNKIQEMALPMLRILNLSNNQIESVAGLSGNPVLKTLYIENNKLATCEGLGVESLEQMTLTSNCITSLKGLEKLAQVAELDLTGNVVEDLTGLPAEGSLTKLVLTQNQVASVEALEPLSAIAIKDLELGENPVMEGLDRVRVVRRIQSLETLNAAPVTEEERAASKEEEAATPGE